MDYFAKLLSKDDNEADVIGFAGLICLAVLCVVTIYVVIVAPQAWNPITFASAVVAHLGGISGGKTIRDRFSDAPSTTASSVTKTPEGDVTAAATKTEGS